MKKKGGNTEADLLNKWNQGDLEILQSVISIVHKDLVRVARTHLRSDRHAETIRTSGLLGEMYLRLLKLDPGNIPLDKEDFLSFASRIMRNLLIDYHRKVGAEKRGGDSTDLTFNESLSVSHTLLNNIEEVVDLIKMWAPRFPRQFRALELHFYLGFKHQEIAEMHNLSLRTSKSDVKFALGILKEQLSS